MVKDASESRYPRISSIRLRVSGNLLLLNLFRRQLSVVLSCTVLQGHNVPKLLRNKIRTTLLKHACCAYLASVVPPMRRGSMAKPREINRPSLSSRNASGCQLVSDQGHDGPSPGKSPPMCLFVSAMEIFNFRPGVREYICRWFLLEHRIICLNKTFVSLHRTGNILAKEGPEVSALLSSSQAWYTSYPFQLTAICQGCCSYSRPDSRRF